MKRPAIAVILLALLALAAVLVGGGLTRATPGTTERVSEDSAGNGGNDLSRSAAISADGPYVALQSRASNLVAGDTTLAPPSGATPFALVTGWNHVCYIGAEQPIEDALAPFLADVAAVYRLRSDQGYDRWFPGRSEVSTITTVSPYKPVLILVTDGATWYQTPSDGPPASASLLPGWNSVCYTGATKPPDDATSGIAEGLTILYRLETTQTWSRHVPSRPEVSNIAQLEQYDAVLMLVTEWGGGIWPEFAVSTGSDERSDPAISGNIVVWNERRGQDWDIRGYDLSTQTEFQITTQEEDQLYPAISGDIVVWQDERTTLPRIYGYDLSSRQEFPVTAESSPQFYPDISGNVVVFRDWRKTGECAWGGTPGFTSDLYYCDWDIWGADLDNSVEFPICTERGVQKPPRVSGNTAVWSDKAEDDGWAIYSYQLGSAAQPIRIATASFNPDLEIDGNIVVWDEWDEVFGYHLLTKSQFLIAIGPEHRDEPDINGNTAVWADKRSGDWNIYGYDLASGKEFPISTAPGDQLDPAIHGDVVVWVDERNSYTEIYGARVPSIGEEQTTNVVPAPTPTPTPTPTPVPTLTPGAPPPAPILLSPANNSLLDTLVPEFRFDVGIPDELDLIWSFNLRHSAGDYADGRFCWGIFGSPVKECDLHENLKPGTIYTWWVEAVNAQCAESDCRVSSEVWSFTTPTEPVTVPAPVLISPVGGVTVDPNNVLFQWNPVEGATKYRLGWGGCPDEYRRTYAFSYMLEPVTATLDPGKTYCWGARARDDYGWSEWAEATFHTSP